MGCGPIEDIGDAIVDVTEGIVGGVFNATGSLLQGAGDLFKELLNIPDLDDLQSALNQNNGVLINQSSNVKKIPVVYGKRKLGGVRSFVGVPQSDSTKLHIVLALCEGEIEAIDEVYIDDVLSTDSEISSLVTVHKYLGTTTQNAHSQLEADFSNVNVTEDLKGVAAVHVILTADQDKFGSFPRINCVVRGKKVYDVRDSTTKYSPNPALCTYDYLTNTIYGKGLPTADIDTQSFIDGANYCDTTMEEYSGSGTTIAYFESNAYVDTAKKLMDNVKALLSSYRAHLPFIGGKYTLVIEKDETSVFTFTQANILKGSFRFGGTSKRLLLNKIKVIFVNPDKNWQSDMRTFDNATYLAEDNDFELSKEINLVGEINQYRADYIAQTYLKKSRQGITCTFVASMEALLVQVGDVVQVTHPTPGWTNKKFRVVKIRIFRSGDLGFSLVEHEPTVYNRTVPAGEPTPPDTDLPNPFSVSAITGLAASSGTSQLILGSDGSILSRVKLTWTDPGNPFVDRYEFQFKLPTDTNWTNATPQIGQSTEAYLIGMEDGKTYNIRARYVNTFMVRSPWTSIDHLIVGKTQEPADVDTFYVGNQADGTREFTWTYDSPPLDFAGFRIRYKTGTGGTWATATDLHTNLLLASPYETNFLAAGTYTFLIKAVDTTGNESVNAKVIETELGDPRIANSILYEDARVLGWPGTKTDCFEHDDGTLISTDSKDWSDFATDGDTWADWTSWNRSPSNPITYQHTTIDVGAVATFVPIISATGDGTVTIEEQHSDDDVTYSSWATVTFTEITTRYIRFRVNVDNGSSLACLKFMTINLSAKPLEQITEDLDISTLTGGNRIATGHVKIPLTLSFQVVKTVSVTLQNVGAGWSVELIAKSDMTNGPEIKVYNSSNTLADATLDVFIRGI